MSGVAGTVGKIAGVVAFAALALSTAGVATIGVVALKSVATYAALASTAASVGASLTASTPPRQGSVSQTTIGSDQDSPWIVGRTYYGGARVQLVGYGATLKKVKNPYLLAADVHSVGGPVDGLEAIYADLAPIAMRPEGPVAGTNGYFREHLWRSFQLGQQVEAAALPLRFPGAPGWGADARLSGKAAIAYNGLFDRDGEVFASGFAQMGAVWRGARCWNPVEDSTYPGGAGASRWAPPGDTAGHDAARATWSFTRSPGLLALRYALGIYERDTRVGGSVYRKTFGAGIPLDGLIVEQFVHLHNVCTANRWNCDGMLFEPSSSKWDNLKRILAAGGAEPCWIGGRLGVRVNAPRIALDTITASDLAEGEIVVGAMQGWEQRLNTIVPKYRSETHRWEYVATDPVQIATYLTEDGEEKREERQYDLVQDPAQARQLAAYELLDRRELGEIELPCKPRMRRYGPGDLLTINLPDVGLVNQPAVVLRRTLDPATMGVTLVLRGETMAKHDFALGRTGTPPPTPALVATPSLDEIALERPVSWDTISDPTGTKPEDNATVGAPEGTNIGGRPVTDVLAAFDAAQAQQNHFETVTIPAVEKAVTDAGERITAAKGRADDAYDRAGQAIEDADTVNRRVDTLIAEGGGGSEGVDSVARVEIKRVDEAAIKRDAAVTRSVETFSSSLRTGAHQAGEFTAEYPLADHWKIGPEASAPALDREGVFIGSAYDGASCLIAEPRAGGVAAFSVATYPVDTNRRYRIATRIGAYSASEPFTPGSKVFIGVACLDDSGNLLDHGSYGSYRYSCLVEVRIGNTSAMGEFAQVMTGEGNDSWQKFAPGTKQVRLCILLNHEGDTPLNTYVDYVRFEDAEGEQRAADVDARVTREVTTLVEKDAALARESVAIEARMGERVSASARDVTTAFTEADRALGTRTSAVEAAAMAAGSAMNANPDFAYWTNPYLPPDAYAGWGEVGLYSRLPASLRPTGYMLEHTAAGINSGFIQTPIYTSGGWYVFEAEVWKTAGTWLGSGLTLHGMYHLSFAADPDINGVAGDVDRGGGVRKWAKLFYVPESGNGYLNFHLMTNWEGFAPVRYDKTLRWISALLRPASDMEIAARKAITETIPAVSARVKATEDTLADLPNRYAAAEVVRTLQAQVAGTQGSGLSDYLTSTITQAATVIADAKTGVVARSVETLRTEYNGRIGVVEQQTGSITGIDGRTEVYWRVTGTTNDGATQISLTKKDGTSPLFYIGANTLIDGNLMVTGTVTSRTIQNGSITNSLTTTGGTYGFQQNTVADTGTLTISIAGTGYVRIDVRLSTNYVDGESGMTAPNMWFLALYCEQNGQQRLVGSTPFREGPYFSFWENDVPSAGIARYFVRITLSVAQRNGTVFNTKINATEYKK